MSAHLADLCSMNALLQIRSLPSSIHVRIFLLMFNNHWHECAVPQPSGSGCYWIIRWWPVKVEPRLGLGLAASACRPLMMSYFSIVAQDMRDTRCRLNTRLLPPT